LAAKRKKTNELRRRADGRYQRQVTVTDPLTGESIKVPIYGRTQEELDRKERAVKTESEKRRRSEAALGIWLYHCLKLKRKSKIQPNTYHSYENAVKNHILPYFGKDRDITTIIKKDIQDFYIYCADEKGITSALKDIRAILLFAFEEAVDNDLITKNPARNVELPDYDEQERRALSQEEEKQFIAVLKDIQTKYINGPKWSGRLNSEEKFMITAGRLLIAYYLGLYAGLRLGESLGLTWGCVDITKGQISVIQQLKRERIDKSKTATKLVIGDPKSKYSIRTIPVRWELIQELENHKAQQTIELGREPRPDELVVINQSGKPQEPRKIDAIMDKLVDMANIDPRIVYHELRHTLATRLDEAGAREEDIARYLGQQTIRLRGKKSVTQGYIHREDLGYLRQFLENPVHMDGNT
jgi:integrase